MKRRNFLKTTAISTAGILSLGSFISVEGYTNDSKTNYQDLSGIWRFQLDPENQGLTQEWFKKELKKEVRLPGSIQEQGIGNDISLDTSWIVRKNYFKKKWFTHPMYKKYRNPDQITIMEWLQPEKHYVGPAWFQRTVTIPEAWENQRVTLHLERCHWETVLWIDGKRVGKRRQLATCQEYDLTGRLEPGRHTLTLRVDNSMIIDVGVNAHSVTDHTQSAWNGIVGRNELQAFPKIWIDDLQVFSDTENKKVQLRIKIGNNTGKKGEGELKLKAKSFNSQSVHEASPKIKMINIPDKEYYTLRLNYPLGKEAKLWSEYNPALYQLSADIKVKTEKGNYHHNYGTTFGLRNIEIDHRTIRINSIPVKLRGNLECCIFPLTGYPPTEVDNWKNIFRKHKAYGFNHVRFHSWCPPKAAFSAADEVGIYIQPEVNVWTRIHNREQRDFLMQESKRMLKEYGNHPSFIMMGLGNEGHCKEDIMRELIHEWKKDPRRIYTGLANSNNSIIDVYDYYIGRIINSLKLRFQGGWPPEPGGNRLQVSKPDTIPNFNEAIQSYDKPLISHEIGQRCSYPRLDQRNKYTGSFSAGYLKIAEDQLRERGMFNQWEEFVKASGEWQIGLYKEEIEAVLRTPDMGGFQLLQLHDFPGQSGALVGVLDAFWENKGYGSPETFRSFCDSTVPLAQMSKRVWTQDELFSAKMQLSHFGMESLNNVKPKFIIENDNGEIEYQKTINPLNVHPGSLLDLGRIDYELSSLKAPVRYRLKAQLIGKSISNSWDFWVYPSVGQNINYGNVRIVNEWNQQVAERLKKGETVLLQVKIDEIKGDLPPCFVSMYWTQFGLNQGESQTMGLLCDPGHPVFEVFPTEYHSNWQWWELLSDARPMIFDGYKHTAPWPKSFRPLVQLIDGWETNRKLGVLAEAQVGKGKLMISSMNLTEDLENRPVARQLLKSVLSYMNSSIFKPRFTVSIQQIEALFKNA